jgi:small-conductance mechanosensitive channel
MSTSGYPVLLVGGQDLERSRLTVFFRYFLLIPHYVVLTLYGIAAVFVILIAWFAALVAGRVPNGMHGFITGYLRYSTRVGAYQAILANPYPPFGSGGSYAVDLEIDTPSHQGRLGVFFRYFLALPCLFVSGILSAVLGLVGFCCWVISLILGRVPEGLQSLGLFCLRFNARTQAYLFLVNPRYPSFGDAPGTLAADQTALPPLP